MTREDRFKTAVTRHFWKGLGVFVCAGILWATVRSVAIDFNEIPTGSMLPTILIGDRVFVNKLAYDLKLPFTSKRLLTWSDPKRGDVVILSSPLDGKLLIKRTIAVPGDAIELRGNHLYVNQTPVAAATSRVLPTGTPVVVPPGKYFVMGDNRDHSVDSRYFGFVDRGRISGKAVGVILSFDPNHTCLPRWGRFLARLD